MNILNIKTLSNEEISELSKTGFAGTYEGTQMNDNILDIKTASEEEIKELGKTGHLGIYEGINIK